MGILVIKLEWTHKFTIALMNNKEGHLLRVHIIMPQDNNNQEDNCVLILLAFKVPYIKDCHKRSKRMIYYCSMA